MFFTFWYLRRKISHLRSRNLGKPGRFDAKYVVWSTRRCPDYREIKQSLVKESARCFEMADRCNAADSKSRTCPYDSGVCSDQRFGRKGLRGGCVDRPAASCEEQEQRFAVCTLKNDRLGDLVYVTADGACGIPCGAREDRFSDVWFYSGGSQGSKYPFQAFAHAVYCVSGPPASRPRLTPRNVGAIVRHDFLGSYHPTSASL